MAPLVYSYHHVVSREYYSTVSPKIKGLFITVENFEKQLLKLLEENYQFLTASQFLELFQQQDKETKAVLLTFDDGQENTYHYAYPILKKYRLPAVFFIITSRIDLPGYLTSSQLNEMNDLVSYHSHTHELHNMKLIKSSTKVQQINDLKKSLEFVEKFNRPEENQVRLFAYPFSISDKFLIQTVKSLDFQMAFIVENRPINYSKDTFYRIPRLAKK